MKSMLLAAATFATITAAAPQLAHANEGFTPFLPGITTGLPLGAMPPPGFYGTSNNYVVTGNVRDGQGSAVPIHVSNYVTNFTVLWSSPYTVLGAHYGADIIQSFASIGVDSRGVGGRKTRSTSGFNPIINPVMLSWNLGKGLFVEVGQSMYLPTGGIHINNGVRNQTSYANSYFTYEPNLAVTYLHDGWNFTVNNVIDVNETDSRTGYHSGDAFYADLTATKAIGNLTIGAIGNYTQQFEDDTSHGKVVADGVQAEHVMIGPLASYNFGKFSLTARYITDVRTRNDVKLTFTHISASTRF